MVYAEKVRQEIIIAIYEPFFNPLRILFTEQRSETRRTRVCRER